MVQKYVVELLDDLDGSDATDTVAFALDGVSYAIDLSDANATKLRDAFSSYVNAARKADSSTRAAKPRATKGAAKPDLGAVREWANANGYEVSSRGRIPTTVTEAYEAAH